jgi:hypothetical protein
MIMGVLPRWQLPWASRHFQQFLHCTLYCSMMCYAAFSVASDAGNDGMRMLFCMDQQASVWKQDIHCASCILCIKMRRWKLTYIGLFLAHKANTSNSVAIYVILSTISLMQYNQGSFFSTAHSTALHPVHARLFYRHLLIIQ